MRKFNIATLSDSLNERIKYKIDHKTKPLGSLGQLEKLAFQIARIQNTLTPYLKNPHIVLVGSDHNICMEGVSPCPQEITWQQMINFSKGGGGIGLFAKQYGLELHIVDAGVNYDFDSDLGIVDAKIKKGSGNFLSEPAMTQDECQSALLNGSKIVDDLQKKGCNILGFGEMGIGNTSPASVLMSIYCNLPIDKCVGPGSGLDSNGVNNKLIVLKSALKKHGRSKNAFETLSTYGGLEIATITGAMLRAAELKMTIINDGFIITSALLAAHAINPTVLEYVIFSHQSKEGGHQYMVDYLNGDPILNLDLRLGEGTGAAIAYPIIEGAIQMLNEMTSFEEAKITDTTAHGESTIK
ncbi:nicotinate-nucleotide--dimethylbenzimidazole phosphoribosyltransferase [bacterium]|nr:nicotinate-nucleotide--dimethylbenzimidazole phosphoribosyltransferase [bacterium]